MDKLIVDQLKELAKEYKIKGRSKLRRKSDLLKELRKIPEIVEMYDNVEPQLGTPPGSPPPTPHPGTPPRRAPAFTKPENKKIPKQKERPTPDPSKKYS